MIEPKYWNTFFMSSSLFVTGMHTQPKQFLMPSSLFVSDIHKHTKQCIYLNQMYGNYEEQKAHLTKQKKRTDAMYW